MPKKNNLQLSPSQEFYYGLLEKEYTSSEEEDLASIPITVDKLKLACINRKCYVELDNLNLYKKLEKKVLKKFPKQISKYNEKDKQKIILKLFNAKTTTYYFPLYDKWEKRREQNKRRRWRRNKIELLRYFEKNCIEEWSQPISTMSFTNQDIGNFAKSSSSVSGSLQLFDYIDSEDVVTMTPIQTQDGITYTHFDLELANRYESSSQPTTSTQNYKTD